MNHRHNLPIVDENDEKLLTLVRPPEWTNPKPKETYTLVVIGGGTGGLVSAIGAASLGATVALVEKNLLGGDCLNYGCVPSKTLIRAARQAHEARGGKKGEERPHELHCFRQAMARAREVRRVISHHDSAERVTGTGVDVFFGTASFKGEDEITVNGTPLRFKRAIIAAGTRPRIPQIPGLEEAGYLTNETVFSLDRNPGSIIVIGGGPIGCELSQAFSRLGWDVTIITKPPRLLPREDPEASEILHRVFHKEGIRVIVEADVVKVEQRERKKIVTYSIKGSLCEVEGDEILISAGRVPNLETLKLEAGGIDYDPRRGVIVDDFLRTTNRRVYAVGDICLPYRFTHTADATARIALRNALFFGRNRVSSLVIPWCTYTDPEIAHVRRAGDGGTAVRLSVTKISLRDVDRAVTDGETEGFLKVWHRGKKGTIERATLVASHAGDIIGALSLAMNAGVSLGKISGTIFPYPTQGEVLRKAGDAFMREKLTEKTKKVLSTYLTFFPR